MISVRTSSAGTPQFHLHNEQISYIFGLAEDGKLLHYYFGAAVPDADYQHLVEYIPYPVSTLRREADRLYSLARCMQELPEYGATDFRHPAIQVRQENGSTLTDFIYESHEIVPGKPKLEGLPASYVEDESEAETLIVHLVDTLSGAKVALLYSIYADRPVIARSAIVENHGAQTLHLENLASFNLDLPDHNYEWVQLSGAWGRERYIKRRSLEAGITAVDSTQGYSSHQQNPFVALVRPETTEHSGTAIGLSFLYSGNFLAQAEVDPWNVTRLQMGINPFGFDWELKPGARFTAPEAVLTYSDEGLNGMSQALHSLLRNRVARGPWRNKERPILINNWEATYFDFTEDKLVSIAKTAKDVGVELFVLDDGWFGQRTSDTAGLGDWYTNTDRLPGGIGSLAAKIRDLGMKFGLWFEPEMVNRDSDMFRNHPEWTIQTPGRPLRHGRHQFVLNYAIPAVVDNIFEQMCAIIDEAKLDYIKWDMNRPLTDVFCAELPASQQGEVFHRFVLGLYDLYERLLERYPNLLIESCASGGGRFDAGLLYYAPQAWTSDDTDAIERMKIQYGTSLAYPISSMGAHVSIVPNHQTRRISPLATRAHVAYFGAFGYELDLNDLSQDEINQVKEQIAFYKQYRHLIHEGTFYRLKSPFESGQEVAWMVVDKNKEQAVVAHFTVLNKVNAAFNRLLLKGLDPNATYTLQEAPDNALRNPQENGVTYPNVPTYSGAALMNMGISTMDSSCGEMLPQNRDRDLPSTDFQSRIWVLKKK
ncbi:MAG: alpha-galactosidase [Corynebacterium sp.]|nr:alpha-galactosidase [Corynebacterium sp.]